MIAALVAGASLFAIASPARAAETGVVANVLPAPSSALQDKVLAQVQALHAGHVRAFLAWDLIETGPGVLDTGRLDAYKSLGDRLKTVGSRLYLVVTNTPPWAGDGDANSAPPPAKFGSFLDRLAAYLGDSVDAYEIWNEPDEKIFWKGGATPAEYAALLKAAYPAVKHGNPAAAVVVGGLVGGDVAFLRGLYDNGAKGSFDAVGIHTDHACGRETPKIAYREQDGSIGRFAFTAYRELHKLMVSKGDDKPIWMTELGWSVSKTKCYIDPSVPGGVSEAQQAQFLSEAYACLAADSYVQRGSWFSIGDYGTNDTSGNRFGLMDKDLVNPRPAFSAFAGAGQLAPDPNCGPRGATAIPTSALKATLVDGQKVSGALKYRFEPPVGLEVQTITLLIDGKKIRTTAGKVLEGSFNSFAGLSSGPHKVTVEFLDVTGTIRRLELTINKVNPGQGEAIPTKLTLGLFGAKRARLVVSKILTTPPSASKFLRSGRISVVFQKKSGKKFKTVGKGKSAPSAKVLKLNQKKLTKGKWRVVITFKGVGSFQPATKVRAFTVK